MAKKEKLKKSELNLEKKTEKWNKILKGKIERKKNNKRIKKQQSREWVSYLIYKKTKWNENGWK